MAELDYSEIVLIAQQLIADTGRAVTMQRLDATAADPDKPWKGAGVPTVAEAVPDVDAVFVPPSGGNLGGMVIDEELLRRAEQVALVAGGATDFRPFHRVLDSNGVVWKIDWIQFLKPADVTLLYAFGLTR